RSWSRSDTTAGRSKGRFPGSCSTGPRPAADADSYSRWRGRNCPNETGFRAPRVLSFFCFETHRTMPDSPERRPVDSNPVDPALTREIAGLIISALNLELTEADID